MVWTYNNSGYANGVSVIGNYAYVANGNFGLDIFDISYNCILDSLILSIDICGCTDTIATNYDSAVITDDGSCIYPTCSEDSPIGLFASYVIHNRATINWDNMNSNICSVDQYRIRYRETGTSSWSTKTMSGPVGSCNFASQKTDKLILNLTANTNYEYQMKAWYCGGGASSWSGIETVSYTHLTLPTKRIV